MRRNLKCLAVLLVMWVGTVSAHALDISPINGSFESPALFPDSIVSPFFVTWQETGPVEPIVDPEFGEFFGRLGAGIFVNVPPSLGGSTADFITNADGSQLAFLSAVSDTGGEAISLYQFSSATYESGLTYQLDVAVGQSSRQPALNFNPNEPPNPLPGPATLAIELIYDDGNGLAVAAQRVIAADEIWDAFGSDDPFLTDFTLSLDVLGGEAWAGESVGVRLRPLEGVAGNWVIDDVRLTQIPEPGTLALLASFGLALLPRRYTANLIRA